MKKKYSRKELIDICEQAIVQQKDWSDRDSASSHLGIGKCWALLKAGCEYEILFTKDGKGCSTNEDTIWIQFYVHDFQWFEYGSESFDDKRGNADLDYHFYLPTEEHLKKANGKDWY